jgi:hypothetical protein
MSLVSRQNGDTLVEVILALVILSTVLVTSISLSRLSRSQSTNSSARLQAVNLMQEQYEALRWMRDNKTWAQFARGANCIGGVCNGIQAAAASDTVPATMGCPAGQYCFHMERSAAGWVACPGAWHPPLDFDNMAAAPGEAADSYVTSYLTIGCRGDFRTITAQPDIQVWISYDDPTVLPVVCPTPKRLYRFFIHASWSQSGAKTGRESTSISTYIGNMKNDPLSC